ncbi:MAG: hypothetical protein IH608_02435, partial [Proteobacteria bacterium]|nr:hypothetical protein [Pseudomonadota bacterium]
MEQYWDCSLCRIEEKGKAPRCRSCYGKLRGRERLLHEVAAARTTRQRGALLSVLAAGLGQMYQRRWLTGVALAGLIPLAFGLVAVTWSGFTYGHVFLVVAALFVLGVAVLDAWLGPKVTVAPCQDTCPARVAIPDYLQLTLDGEHEQGYALVRTRIPLVGAIGRVCPHPCEARCLRGIDGESISVNGCKRFLADKHRETLREASAAGAQRTVRLEGGGLS